MKINPIGNLVKTNPIKPNFPPIFQFCILVIRIYFEFLPPKAGLIETQRCWAEGGFDRDPAVLGGFHILLSLLCLLRSKKVFAINPRPCIIGFMVETRTIRSPHKAILSLNTLLLRRKAQ